MHCPRKYVTLHLFALLQTDLLKHTIYYRQINISVAIEALSVLIQQYRNDSFYYLILA